MTRKLTGADGVDLALDLDHAVLASEQMDSMVDLGIFDQDVLGIFVVFLAGKRQCRTWYYILMWYVYSRRSTWSRPTWSRRASSA